MGVKILRAVELFAREFLVGNRLAVIRIGAGNVGAADAQQQLALLHRISKASSNLHHAPEASETTGTFREMSGVTVPVNTNSGLELRATP